MSMLTSIEVSGKLDNASTNVESAKRVAFPRSADQYVPPDEEIAMKDSAMSDHAVRDHAVPAPDAAIRPTTCCDPTAGARPAVEVTVAAAPCCGTAEQAASAGACCAPAAEREAVAAGAGCC
ncbi:hypothetical protein [Kitasatospora indigofera]|uniref:hypothetical protein n=1 Tax=Kitasatospora indigofera TaxID=67307 RepID=UPI0036A4FEE4